MRNISDTIARLHSARGISLPGSISKQSSRLAEMPAFDHNPGALKAYSYLPAQLPKGAPLVVVLHGCTQTAAGYDNGSGWSRMADQHGFAVLYPEQQRANNPNLCFNWFVPGDMQRDSGEPFSIVSMIRKIVELHGLDHRRVYITGLSAGGAMASVMLATYPDVFAGGAIIAGLPYGSATSIPEALDRMRGHGLPTEKALQAELRRASDHRGPWPTISVWHGSRDLTVVPANMAAIVAQWSEVHEVGSVPTSAQTIDGHSRRIWTDAAGVSRVEEFTIAGMGHGTPLRAGDGIGTPGAFMLDAGISSTSHIADFWGLISSELRPAAETMPGENKSQPGRDRTAFEAPASVGKAKSAAGIGKVIEDALRAAGLMR